MKKGVTFMTEEVRRYGVVAALLDGRMTNGNPEYACYNFAAFL
jgi:hypothetical protein